MKTVGSRAEVMHGTASQTAGGLEKKHLKVSKSSGEVVSKKKAKSGVKNGWAQATEMALEEFKKLPKSNPLHVSAAGEMILMNVGKKGKALYKRTKEIYLGR
jgi:hypothetical protein